MRFVGGGGGGGGGYVRMCVSNACENIFKSARMRTRKLVFNFSSPSICECLAHLERE